MNAFQDCSETSGRGSLPKCFSSTLLDRSKLCPFPFPRKSRGDAAPREGQGGLASSASSPEMLWNGLCLKQGLLAGVCAGFVSCGSSLSLFLTLAEQAVGTDSFWARQVTVLVRQMEVFSLGQCRHQFSPAGCTLELTHKFKRPLSSRSLLRYPV